MEDEKMTEGDSNEAKLSAENLIISLDPQSRRRILAVEETGTEHFEPFLAYNEKLLSLLQRVDFGQVIEEDVKKESKLVQEWLWKGIYENVQEAQMELGYIMDFIAHVQANIEVDVVMVNRPKQTAEEILKDKAICLMTKLQSFNNVSKYIKQSARSLSQQISRDATFYGALMRLQQNWKVRQKKDRTTGSGGNAGFIIVLSDDALINPRLSLQLSSIFSIDLDQDSSGMLTANLPRHSSFSLHVRYNKCRSGHQKWEYIRKNSSSLLPAYDSHDESKIINQETDGGVANSISKGVDKGSMRAHLNFRNILAEIFDAQVFEFLIRGIDAVSIIGIGENFLQINLSPKTALTVSLEYALSSNENDFDDAEMKEGDLRHSKESKNLEYEEREGNDTTIESQKNKAHQMDVDTKLYENDMFSKSKERCPNPLSSELYLEQIVHQNKFGPHSPRYTVMSTKTEADLRAGTGRGQSNTINALEHFYITLIHRIYSYKVLDVLEKLVQLQYLRLVSHPTWKADTSVWFLFLAIPETVRQRDQTKVLIDAQKNVRSRYYSKIVVHKELLTIEGGPVPCVGGLFSGTSTEIRSTNEYSCGLADLASFLLQQVGSQIVYWLHEEVAALRYKVKRDFLCLSFKISESHTVSLVASPNVQEYTINWSLKVENIMLDDELATSNSSSIELENHFLGPLNVESLYEVVINIVVLYKIF